MHASGRGTPTAARAVLLALMWLAACMGAGRTHAQDAIPRAVNRTTIPADNATANTSLLKVIDRAAKAGKKPATTTAVKPADNALAPKSAPAPAAVAKPRKDDRAPGAVVNDPALTAETKANLPVPAKLETGAIGSADPPGETTQYADWMLECMRADGRENCALRQTVTDIKGRRIVQIVARYSGKAAYLEVIVPIGISIPFGVMLQLSETTKITARLADCDPLGCRAVAPLDDKTRAEIKSATTWAVVFQDSKSGQVLKVIGSPNGFSDGIGKVTAGG